MRDNTCFSWQWDVGRQLISILAQHQYSGIDHGLCQGLDWREVINLYSNGGATYTVKDRAQLEPWGMDEDDWLWWFWDPSGSMDGRFSQQFVWNLGIKGLIHVWLAWRHGVVQWFIRDPGMSFKMPLQWTYTDFLRASNLGVRGFVMSPFYFPL